MIAAGLCAMGGCFAQDADGAVVDTYWPAAKASMGGTNSWAWRSEVYGGDSDTDYLRIVMDADISGTKPSTMTNIIGLNNSPGGSDVNSFRVNLQTGFFRYSIGTAFEGLPVKSSFESVAAEGVARVWDATPKLTEVVPAYFSAEGKTRLLGVYNNGVTKFGFLQYRNAVMGASVTLQAMRSAAGGDALYEVEKKVLVEI